MMRILQKVLEKVVRPISKKTGLSPQTVTMIITVGLPIVMKMFTKKRSRGTRRVRRSRS